MLPTLPGAPAIVAKRELAQQRVAGPILRRLGIPFVERYGLSGSLTDAAMLEALALRPTTTTPRRSAPTPST
jgi:1-acyl-sn-glycerol-3-phosphate acyltransferase